MANSSSRTRNSIRNGIYIIVFNILNTIFSFSQRTIFIKVLGVEYLGVSGLFSNILSLFSLAELGIGAAITYFLYKPLSDNEKSLVNSYMKLYAKVYKIIGISVLIIGVSLLPFLQYIVKEQNIENLSLIYILYVINSAVTYSFSYKRTLLIADQNSYINTINQYSFMFLQYLLQILILVATQNFLLFLLVSNITNVCSNLLISRKVNKMYTYILESATKLSAERITQLKRYVYGLMSHKIGGTLVVGTDNLIISIFLGVYWVGLYSNYLMIVGIINTVLSQVFDQVTASVGNLIATDDRNKKYFIFKNLYFINAWFYGFSAICLFILINPFITIWIGSDFTMSMTVVSIIVLNFYLSGLRKIILSFTSAAGLYWNSRYKPLIEALINLSFSIILVHYYGIIGILLGTLISNLTTNFVVEPYIVFKNVFGVNVKHYYKVLVMYIGFCIMALLITILLANLSSGDGIISFFIKMLTCLIVPNIIFVFLYRKTQEYKYFAEMVKGKVPLFGKSA